MVTVSGPGGSPVPTGHSLVFGGNYTAASVALNNGADDLHDTAGVLAVGSTR